jgi:hypothetical protein
MPRRETRHDIERQMSAQRRNRQLKRADLERMIARMEEHKARMEALLDPAELARQRAEFQDAMRRLAAEVRRRRRRPGDGNMPAPVEPPRGPRPLAGGAAAALDFD